MEWVQAINELTQGQVIAIDGKQLRGSQDSESGKAAKGGIKTERLQCGWNVDYLLKVLAG
jgi:hypothetical protein